MDLLLLDDDPAILFMVSKTLEKSGDFSVDTAETTEEAFKLIHGKKYDVILSDFMMEDMDGDEFIEKLSSLGILNDVPLIFLTAKNDEASLKQFKALGAKGVITKPFVPKKLNKNILEILNDNHFNPQD